MQLINTAQTALQSAHDNTETNVQRWGYISKTGGVAPYSGGCYASMYVREYANNTYKYLVFQGDGPELTIEELADFDKQNEKIGANPRGFNQFEGTERSLEWIKFLLSDKSPWRALHDNLVVKDAETINKSGWLFERLDKISNKLYYNFAMGQRMLWENAPCASHWYHLVDKGVDPTQALFIAANFMLSPGATSIVGPYSVYYPWSFLEGGTLCCAKAFITGQPRCEVGDKNTPNVLPLWQCKNPEPWIERTNELSTRTDLLLPEILDVVEEAVETQEV